MVTREAVAPQVHARSRAVKIALLLAFFVCACAAPLPRPDAPGASDVYRRELALHPKGPRAREAREKLEQAQYAEARDAHTIFAYRRFLEEFPESHQASQVRTLLESLRWSEAEHDGSASALAGFLADEPSGPHAQAAWARLSAVTLEAALHDDGAPALQEWLAQHPSAAGSERALQALDEAEYRAARDPEALRAYLAAHPDGTHRREADARLARTDVDEALVLEDEARLRTLKDPAADRLAYERAAALLDEGRLAQLARRGGPFAPRAAEDLAALRHDPRRATTLELAAHRLYLPRATLDLLPETGPERATALRSWAAALEGERLPRLLAEMASPRAQVSLAALDSVEVLLKGLPRAEAALRAERALLLLKPRAQAAPQLAEVALLEKALGRGPEALAAARTAAGIDPHCTVALWLSTQLEKERGEPVLEAQALRTQARALADAHFDGARKGDKGAAQELCAASRAADAASALLDSDAARADAAALQRKAEEGERAAAISCAVPSVGAAQAFERRAAAYQLVEVHSKLADAALARAAARDPDAEVRAIATAAAQAKAAVPPKPSSAEHAPSQYAPSHPGADAAPLR